MSSFVVISFFFIWIIVGCSNPGDQPIADDTKSSSPTPTPGADEDLSDSQDSLPLGVRLGRLDPQLAPLLDCPKTAERLVPLSLDSQFRLDGSAQEWLDLTTIIADPTADVARQTLDLRRGWLAKVAGEIPLWAGLIEFRAPADESELRNDLAFHWEFGHFSIDSQGALSLARSRSYRFYEGVLSERKNEHWVPLETQFGQAKLTDHYLEWQLEARQLDGLTKQPGWWMRVFVISSGRNFQTHDETHAVYFLDSEHPAQVLSMQRCEFEQVRSKSPSQAVVFSEIADRELDAVAKKTGFAVYRRILTDVFNMLPELDLPVAELSLVLTQKPVHNQTESLSHGLQVSLSELELDDLKHARYGRLYRSLSRQLLKQILKHNFSNAPEYLIRVVSYALLDHLEQHQLDSGYWLGFYRSSIFAFIDQLDLEQPQTLLALNQRLQEPFDSPESKDAYHQRTRAKEYGFAHLLGNQLSAQKLWQTWLLAAKQAQQADALSSWTEALAHTLNSESMRDELLAGWLIDSPYEPVFSPKSLLDDDHDGLPNYWEKAHGSQPDQFDTDEDGWSDLAELFQKTDLLSAASTPGLIVADGYFGDWQVLVPTKVHRHLSSSEGECEAYGKINLYGALADHSQLIIGALAKGDWDGSRPLSWEAQIELIRSRKQLLVRADAGSYEVQILDARSQEILYRYNTAVAQAYKTNEWHVDFTQLGLSSDIRKEGLKLRMTTILEEAERKRCDETAWFYPVFVDSD